MAFSLQHNGFLSKRDINFNVRRAVTQTPYVLADSVRIREVPVNILGNAVKFTDDGGTIDFETECRPEDDKHIVITYRISDTGIGMSEEYLKHIFDEFSQEESGARTQYKGTGLGMAITKRYVELTDKESVEKLDMPVHRTDLSVLRVLVAEDNDLNAEIAAVQLEDPGMRVTRFDLILMDIMMPVMNEAYRCDIIISSINLLLFVKPFSEKIKIFRQIKWHNNKAEKQ